MPATGLQLTVLAGATVPVPLAPDVIARLRTVRVSESDEERSAFTLIFDAGRSGTQGAVDTPVLQGSPLAAFARVGAVIGMTVDDYYPEGRRFWLRLHEKGGKRHEMPAHHKLEAYLDEYLDAAGIRNQSHSPLFRSTIGKTGILTGLPMHRIDV